MREAYKGSCLCGDVRFEVQGDFEHFFLWHCSRCRKDTGSAHAANLFSSTATLAWLSGEQNVRTFVLPGTRHTKSFCARCGSALPRVEMDGALLVVPAGCLDSPVEMRPDAHICVASSAPWDHDLEAIAKVPALPQ